MSGGKLAAVNTKSTLVFVRTGDQCTEIITRNSDVSRAIKRPPRCRIFLVARLANFQEPRPVFYLSVQRTPREILRCTLVCTDIARNDVVSQRFKIRVVIHFLCFILRLYVFSKYD